MTTPTTDPSTTDPEIPDSETVVVAGTTVATATTEAATTVESSPTPTDEPDPSPEGGGRRGSIRGAFTGPRLLAFLREMWPPALGIGGFLVLWAALAPRVDTQLGQLPGPVQAWEAAVGLYDQYQASRAEEAAFYQAQELRNVELVANGQPAQDFAFNGPPTFLDQIWTSLQTVAFGFAIGTVVAIPIGLLSGLSATFNKAINPLVQIFRPVSPLAWLPIVTMIISATMTSADPLLPKSFIISALVVTLCSVWPTLINTSVGASSVDKDLLNVAEVLRLNWFTRLRKIILPSAVPYIFTGMRLSLGVGWMVLIAAEMLAQNPGLGKFVWDEFQNGSSQSLSRIMVAVLVIGIIGFLLDRLMAFLESLVGRNRVAA